MIIHKPPLSDFAKYHEGLRVGQHDAVAQEIIDQITVNKPRVKGDGFHYFSQIIPGMLDFEWYTEVGSLLWGSMFTVDPWSVRTIWNSLLTKPDWLIIGAGSLGKSYSVGAWAVLDYARDPLQTCFKVVSLTREHAKRNAFANMQNLFRASIIPLPGEVTATSIQADENPKQGIHLEALRVGEDGQGKLRGFHPDPRSRPHAQFRKTRIRAIVDEAEEAPSGVWSDLDNLNTSRFDDEHVKIICAANPRDPNSKMGQRAEPAFGWGSIDMVSLEHWVSKAGWNVLHLNGANCENVKEKRVIYPGLLTYEGFMRYLALGEHNPDYYTMALGIYPRQGLQSTIIPSDFVTKNIGTFHFLGETTQVSAFDLAFEGGDALVCTVGKFGLAIGWTDAHRQYHKFPEEKGRFAIQVEAQFQMPKKDTLELTHDIISMNQHLRVTPRWCCVDRTGNGTGVFHALRTLFGPEVMGVHYGEAATESRLFVEDSKKAEELYSGVVTELFYALRGALEFEVMKLSPSLDFSKLSPQLTDRRVRRQGGKQRVEPKEEFRPRHGASPDEADSLTLFNHVIRMNADTTFRMTPAPVQQKHQPIKVGAVDKLQFVNMSSD